MKKVEMCVLWVGVRERENQGSSNKRITLKKRRRAGSLPFHHILFLTRGFCTGPVLWVLFFIIISSHLISSHHIMYIKERHSCPDTSDTMITVIRTVGIHLYIIRNTPWTIQHTVYASLKIVIDKNSKDRKKIYIENNLCLTLINMVVYWKQPLL